MTYQKPYTFRAGTYAKAAEVNTNFDTIKNFVDGLEEQIGNVETSSAVYNKANINGNASIKFNVANGTEANNAVNFGQLQSVASQVNGLWQPPSYTNYKEYTTAVDMTVNGNSVVEIITSSTAVGFYLAGVYRIIPQNSIVTYPVVSGTSIKTLTDCTVRIYTDDGGI